MSLFGRMQHSKERKIKLGAVHEELNTNQVFTAKYSALTFFPKCLFLQFLRLSNVVFLANAILQFIPILSAISPFTAIGPISFVLLISMIREAYEDRKRHRKDEEINSRNTRVLRQGQFQVVNWSEVRVGDFIKISNMEIVPADILLLYSPEQNSMCYVETANLDGESNLKEKFAFNEGINKFPHQFQSLSGECVVGQPEANLHEFNGTFFMEGLEPQYIGLHNMLLRETTLKNTEYVVGLALYCGYDTKILKNQGQVHHKMSQIQSKLNRIQVVFLIILACICGTCSLGYWIVSSRHNLREPNSYIPHKGISLATQSGLNFLTVFLLMNFLIPISLVILMQGIKTFSGVFLSIDKKMQTEGHSCGVLNSSILQELGVVDYVLTDKTGTLTANEMAFRKIALLGKMYDYQFLQSNPEEIKSNANIREFFEGIVICHEVVRDSLKKEFQGSSPDEVCFVGFAKTIGFEFVKRPKTHVQLNILGEKMVYQLVDILPFSSRKRMSVVVKNPFKPSEVIVYTKGADSNIFEKSKPFEFLDKISKNIDSFAKEGLRTLVFAKKVVSLEVYQSFLDRRSRAKKKMMEKLCEKEEYQNELNAITEEIESQLDVIGASGIEDRLQEEVPETIQRLQRAGIVVMMITGDKLETAENIGYLARLIRDNYQVVRLSSAIVDLKTEREYILDRINTNIPLSVIIQGKQIASIIHQSDPSSLEAYKTIFLKAKSIIFCRSSPKQKAEIVRFIKNNMNATVLAIGDGGNDVGMIEEAHIGVGIIGKQGNSAAGVSDFSFGRFRLLDRLLLHHGRWLYRRLSYFFIFYGWKNIIITFVMFFGNIQSCFSGTINFTQLFYVLYNSFFAVAQIVSSGLYQQDINDDLHPRIWKYLPEIYKETKEKQLFSYKRYAKWSAVAIFTALLINQIVIHSLSPLSSVDAFGHTADLFTQRIANGICLVFIIIMVNYLDTQSHFLLYEVLIFWFSSMLLTLTFFVVMNHMKLTGYYHLYSGNFNPRFVLTIFVTVMIIILSKMLILIWDIESSPSIIDLYKMYHQKNQNILDEILGTCVQFDSEINLKNENKIVQIASVKQEEGVKESIQGNEQENRANSQMFMQNEVLVPVIIETDSSSNRVVYPQIINLD